MPSPGDPNPERRNGHRARDADTPAEIPQVGLRDILLRVKDKIGRDNVALVSAGIAFYGLLALVPGIGVLVSLYGLVADPSDIAAHIESFPGFPNEVKDLLAKQLQEGAESPGVLSVGFAGALLLSLFSAARATKALIIAMNIAYEADETRSFVRRNVVSVLVTAGLLIAMVVSLLIIAILPTALDYLGLPIVQTVAAQTLPWFFVVGGCVLGLSLLYRHGPNRSNPKWRWVTPGAVLATSGWLVSSVGFSWFVASFGRFNQTYGAVGAVVVLLLWFWISAFVIVLGAELDAHIEHQTDEDSTVGRPEPMGERGAYVADKEAPIP